ncbi:hypothetical protein COLO4_09905 [Corchorus olitorius]|uniref:F-box associated beta-propeller type 1 domain-containing protein n=1 Tax=Corchorus olitorius TaxID=93759 RepID=A0A1R3KAT8_9ROSI|nr:hypothetical protein COLO4_09905 [Corchorus olitorius]
MHVARSPVSLLISYKFPGLTCLTQVKKDLSPTSFSDSRVKGKVAKSIDLVTESIDLHETSLIGSCHGLICLFGRKNSKTYIINPLFGSNNGFVMLPELHKGVESLKVVPTFYVWGFGYCPKTKQYKVIRSIRNTSMVYVYTLGTDDSWRIIKDHIVPTDRFTSGLPGVYLNGSLHWLTCLKIKSDDRKPEIYCFDLDSERFHQLDHDLLPQIPQGWGRTKLEGLKLGVLDNCLALYINGFYFQQGYFSNFDIWVMKNETSSWVNIFRISEVVAVSSVWSRIEPLMLTEDGKVLITYNDEDRSLEYYDVRTGMFLANRTLSRLIEKRSRTSDRRYIGHVSTSILSPQYMRQSTNQDNQIWSC